MSSLSTRFPKQCEWHELSDKLVRWHRLPYGSRFDLVYDGHPAHGDRKVRGNIKVRRRRLIGKEHPRVEDKPNIRISEVISNTERMISFRLSARRMRIVAIQPDGTPFPTDRGTVRRWREKEPVPTPDERKAKHLREEEIELDLCPKARALLDEIEELVEDPEMKIPHAILLELTKRFGKPTVQEAWVEVGRRV